jgi:hypothetical protein
LVGLKPNAHGLQLVWGIKSIVRVTVPDQLLRIGAIEGFALALPVWTNGASFEGAFIRFESAPGKAVHNILFSTRDEAVLIGVFDPQHEISPVPAGKKVIIKDGPDPAQMEATRGTGGKTDPDSLIRHVAKIGWAPGTPPSLPGNP